MFTWTNFEIQEGSTATAPFVPALSLVSSETEFQTTKSLKTEGPNHLDHIASGPISMVNVHQTTPNLIVQSNTEIFQPLLNLHETSGDLITGQCDECRRGAHLSNGPQCCLYLSVEVNCNTQF